ncbi:hypothetical protein GGR50DRAFT_259978 [Xylaria sp. CBS 124048]|nr:hypothetical protein GGR50DRAFT_259978 [Xylaria sp. CBS 124048]
MYLTVMVKRVVLLLGVKLVQADSNPASITKALARPLRCYRRVETPALAIYITCCCILALGEGLTKGGKKGGRIGNPAPNPLDGQEID